MYLRNKNTAASAATLKASDCQITANIATFDNAIYVDDNYFGNGLMVSDFNRAKIGGINSYQNGWNLGGNMYSTVDEVVNIFQELSSYQPTVIKGLTIKSRKRIPNGDVFMRFSYKCRKRKKNYHIEN